MHAIGDFFLQGSKLSKLKALKFSYLLEHVGIYTSLFIILSPFILGLSFLQALAFSFLNGGFHLAIDFFTGKYKEKYLYVDESKYIKTIGIDHTLHITILLASYIYLFPNAMYAYYGLY